MTGVIKKLFSIQTLGLFGKAKAEGPSEGELIAQAQSRSDEEQRAAELQSEAGTRITGRAKKAGRQLLAFLPGQAGKKDTVG